MNIKRLLFCTALALGSFSYLQAQNSFEHGILPSINLNHKVNELYTFNFELETRERFANGFIGDDTIWDHKHVLTDLTLIGSKKIGLTERLNFGFLVRFREGEVVRRSIQQFTFISRMNRFNIASRIATDQTFENNEKVAFRLRYRVGVELPLQGEKTDPNEPFLKFNNELIQTWQNGSTPLLEYRFGPSIGYLLKAGHVVELGLDYRNSAILNTPRRNSYWYTLNWILKL